MSADGSPLRVTVEDRTGKRPIPRAQVVDLLSGTARLVGSPPGEISVVFTSDTEMRGLNRRFRGMNRPTDVLSFPDTNPVGLSEARIGDIIIGVPTARRNAVRAGLALRQELRHLLIHGFLHLMGYDHEVDDGEMEALETRIRSRIAAPSARRGRS